MNALSKQEIAALREGDTEAICRKKRRRTLMETPSWAETSASRLSKTTKMCALLPSRCFPSLDTEFTEAKDADAALALLEHGVEFDVLFLNVVRPGRLQSKELARLVHQKHPATAILFTSGYTGNAIVHGGRLDEGTALLIKPYTELQLARKFRQVIGRADGDLGRGVGGAQ